MHTDYRRHLQHKHSYRNIRAKLNQFALETPSVVGVKNNNLDVTRVCIIWIMSIALAGSRTYGSHIEACVTSIVLLNVTLDVNAYR